MISCSLKQFLIFLFDVRRVKLIIEEIEREEAALRGDLYSVDQKFAEYYNVYEEFHDMYNNCGFIFFS